MSQGEREGQANKTAELKTDFDFNGDTRAEG